MHDVSRLLRRVECGGNRLRFIFARHSRKTPEYESGGDEASALQRVYGKYSVAEMKRPSFVVLLTTTA
jgi:hypothetical protein